MRDVIQHFNLRKITNLNSVHNIWIANETSLILDEEKYVDENTDVIVTTKNSEKYIATFFTYKNIESLRQKNIATGECNNGAYFWASDMIIVDKINRKSIEQTINSLIENGEFELIFKKIEN